MKTPKEFIKEKEYLNIFEMIKNNKSSLCYTDNNKYLIGRYKKELPTWIWTSDAIGEEKIREIIEIIKDKYKDGNKFTII